MGKKNRRLNRRKARNRQKATYNEHAHQRYTDRLVADEAYKTKQSAYSKKIQALEIEKLHRTVFVTNVLDLTQEQNLRNLQRFMEMNYGPVQECVKDKYRGKRKGKSKSRYPPARVRFQRKQDAEKLFGGRSLNGASQVAITCSTAGNRGKIFVRPAQRYENMIEEGDLKGSIIDFPIGGIALGHWCPDDEDAYLTWKQALGEAPGAKSKPSEEWVEEIGVESAFKVQIDLSKRQVEISLTGGGGDIFGFDVDTNYFMSFRFKTLRNYIDVCRESSKWGSFSLVFALKHPPLLESLVASPILEAVVDIERQRCIEVPGIANEYFGRCLGIKIPLDDAGLSRLLAHEGFKRLVDFGVMRPGLRSLDAGFLCHSDEVTIIHPTIISHLHKDRVVLADQLAKIHGVDKELGFFIRSLMDEGKFSWYHLMYNRKDARSLLDVLCDPSWHSGQGRKVVQILENIVGGEGGSTKYPYDLFDTLRTMESWSATTSAPPSYCMRIPRVLLSPCRTRVLGSETEVSNRVLRRFVDSIGFSPTSFLRLQVGDENGQKLFSRDLSESVVSRMRDKLINGLVINGRVYNFLAYSSSQLKECSVWMVCLEKGYTVPSIRNDLGDFSACVSASKYAARIGQCFSTTIQGLPGGSLQSTTSAAHLVSLFAANVGHLFSRNGEGLPNDSLPATNSAGSVIYSQINDVPVSQGVTSNGKIHSDGTGLITRNRMNALLKGVPFAPQDPNCASIVQIRFGGVKGTLVAWDFDTIRKHTRFSVPHQASVLIRPSMIKFKAPYANVEVCSVGSTIPYYLNRNVIMILSVMGVPDETFLAIQAKMLRDLDQMLISRSKAMEIVPRLSGPDSSVRATIGKMLESGLTPKNEPFLFSLLHAVRSHHLFRLRKKARVFIDQGAVLMGGLDETGLVPEGCVFVQIQPRRGASGKQDSQLITGPVMVTKHPVMHPGDVRMLLAVDIRALHGHKNVILFSRHGPRPEPDKMAGSDLDGDEFAVTWDNRLFLKNWNGRYASLDGVTAYHTTQALIKSLQDSNYPPLDYAPEARSPPPFPPDDSLKTAALVQHFVDHTKNDNLGRIAMMWLDYAATKGADCEECLKLAQLHSLAVDFPKSGIPAEIPRELILGGSTARAHWREYKHGLSFHCKTAVGQLYDEVTNREDDTEKTMAAWALAGRRVDKYGQILATVDTIRRAKLEDMYDPAIPLRLGLEMNLDPTDDLAISFAIDIKNLYDDDILMLMNRFKVRSEGELFTGCIRKFHKLHKRREHAVAEEVRREVRKLTADYRTQFFEAVKDLSNDNSSPDDSSDLSEEDEVGMDETGVERESGIKHGNESDNDEQQEEALAWFEDLATSKSLHSISPREQHVRNIAFRLAAACYYATYYPGAWYKNETRKTVLFGFPWMVCADVIAAGLEEATD